MKHRKFIRSALAGTAAFTSTGVGLLLSGCAKGPLEERKDLINKASAPFAAYPHDPVRAENFTNPLFIRSNYIDHFAGDVYIAHDSSLMTRTPPDAIAPIARSS